MRTAPELIPPCATEVHVWAVSIGDPPVSLQQLWQVLSQEQQRRADRFRLADDRARAILGGGVARMILAAYLDAAPEELQFLQGEHGKPILAGPLRRTLEFNLSHSGNWVLIAVGRDHAVGIDVEQVRPIPDMESIMGKFFAPGEAERIASLPQAARTEAFFTCWTRKEAYIKAVGAGLNLALDRFEVTVRSGEPAALLTLEGSAEQAARWTLWSGVPAAGYLAAAAVAARGVNVVPRYWTASSGIVPWRA